MTLNERIEKLRQDFSSGKFIDSPEAEIRSGAVDPILRNLDVPTDDNQIFKPDYSNKKGRVSIALCRPPSKPVVFVEVKAQETIDDSAVDQLCKFAVTQEIKEAVLTDGQEWHFFHPTAQGDFERSRVCTVDLVSDDTNVAACRFQRYLNYDAIDTGVAIESIKQDHNARVHLPRAWQELVRKPDKVFSETLLDCVGEKVQELSGQKPDVNLVLDFLNGLRHDELGTEQVQTHPSIGARRKKGKKKSRPPKRLAVTMPDGRRIELPNGSDTFVEVIKAIGVAKCAPHCQKAIRKDSSTYTDKMMNRTKEIEGYYVHTGLASLVMKRYLEDIAIGTSVALTIETPEKSQEIQ